MSSLVLPALMPLRSPVGYRIPTSFTTSANRVWETAAAKVGQLIERHPDTFPMYTKEGQWAIGAESWTNWCEGFLGGELWILSQRAAQPQRATYRVAAERYSSLIEERKTDASVHDLGFLFWPTYRRWYEETGNPSLNEVLIEAGRTTAGRYRRAGRYLPSFRSPDSLFIDIMMNVHMALYASQQTGDDALAQVAIEHSLTSRRYLVRGDGSASHEAMFDPDTGTFLRQTTQQGFSDNGSWARGQAWALYGFGTVYRFTGDRRFLATARATADFYIERTGQRMVPPNDWEEPNPTRAYESSAAAAAAGGLWQLAGLVDDQAAARHYADYALGIIDQLAGQEFLSSPDDPWEGILKHATYHERKGLGVDESVMWGDYWLLDAVDAIQTEADSLANAALRAG
jgi:unsaturated chondroitin disaccharide hydrolase